MAHSNQARKRIRQNEKNRLRNKARMSSIKTVTKAALAAVQVGGDKTKARAAVVKACQTIDKAAKSKVIHANNAARRKSQLMRLLNAMK